MKREFIFSKTLELLLLLSAFVLTNSTAFSFTLQFPDVRLWSGHAWMTVSIAIVALIGMGLHLKQKALISAYKDVWKEQPFLFLFIAFSIFSLLWSIYLEASLYKVFMLLYSTLMGAYLALLYGVRKGFTIIRSAAVIFIFGSLFLLVISEPFSRLLNHPYYGAWRGLFWHRNHLGSLMAFFSALFFVQIIASRGKWVAVGVNVIYFLLAAVLVFGSRSATGILLFFILNVLVIVGMVWLEIRHRLERTHYLAILALAGLIFTFAALNLDFIFSLVGRDATMTGRTVIWKDLITRVWPERPLFGFGFGALWMIDAFRTGMEVRHGWPYQVFFSDNGYLDFLLNVGVAGFGIFLVYFVRTGIRSFKALARHGSYLSLLLPLTFLYILIANISYSFFLEIDQFVWMLLVMVSVWSADPERSPG